MHLESDLHKMRSLSGCDEFPIGCSPHKYQLFKCVVILTQTSMFHPLYIVCVMCVVQGFDSFNLLCVRKTLFKK
jgi:hypothetical protein